jgi:hypothetical protein
MGYARVTGYDVGDTRIATLLISSGGDGTTGTVLTVTRPDGTTFLPGTQTTDGGTNWRTTLAYTITQAGDWVESWTVTGTGAGAEGQIVGVSGTPPTSMAGVYATPAQYASFVGGTLPTNLQRLLRKASQDVDADLLASVYSATDAPTIAVLAEATCEQVAYYLDNGWPNGSPLPVASVSIGSASLSGLLGGSAGVRSGGGGGAASPGQRLGPRAWGILQRAGLTGQPPNTQAAWFWS